MKRKHLALLCALVLVTLAPFSLLGCGGCAGSRHEGEGAKDQTTATDTAAPAASHVKAAQARAPEALSPDALDTYAFLVYAHGLNNEDESALAAAAPLMSRARMPAGIWLEGGVWLVSRKSPVAVPYLDAALLTWPEDMSLNLLHAEALADQGQAARGVALMRAYLKKHPKSLDARLELALLLVKDKQFTEAGELLDAIPEQQRTPLVDYYHARALLGMDRPDAAVPYLQKAVKKAPDFVEALAELAFVYEQRGNLPAARAAYEKLLKLDFSPQDVLLRLIHISLRLNQPERALKYMRQGPDTPPFRLTVASMLMDSRHYLQAERLLKQLAAQGNAPDEVYLLLADLTYAQRRELDVALAWLDHIPAKSKAAGRATLLRAQLQAEAGQNEAALATVRARRKTADAPELCDAEIRLLARLKRMPEALLAAKTGAALWPDQAELAFLLGSVLDESGDKKAAMEIMEKVIALQPDNFQALNYVGYTLAEQGRDLDRALQLLGRADELSPNQSYIIDSLAWALFKSGRLEEALTQIRRAVKLGERIDPSIWEHYGDIAARLGLKDEARTAYSKALELKPANAEALRQRLSQL
ncbi:tetratricopeptide repeat protein [Desulfovibrio legallii]|uniref:Tetratricopeptide repeat protein n=3 Tax=Desulfovibrio TaxID=872 RepID=A0A6H3FAZ8_9BACT|nr:tetratricopeptide repeat protein [Desulfovibrio legallii]RHH25778.1 hypothetical protein DW219_02595 [Desulfovibrio sp. AM18-2]TBH79866.1 tetratricopeptide repeat protein [Desulfovibrio legallii]CAI3220270.1 Tetratricopeptide TPR_2 repeat protein [Desulfovibrio diazotrophicus]